MLNHGQVVEQGSAMQVIRQPSDEYTRLLLEAIPRLNQTGNGLVGYIPTAEPTRLHVDMPIFPQE